MAMPPTAPFPPPRPHPHGSRTARALKPLRSPLSRPLKEFLDEVEQALAPATLRAYQVPLTLQPGCLRATHDQDDHEATLDQFTGD